MDYSSERPCGLSASKRDSKADSAPSVSSEGDAIKVFLRVRPPESGAGCSGLPISGRVVEVNANNNSVTLLAKPDPKVFTFDHVADIHSTQESVFSAVGKLLIESCVAGYNGTIFAYGQTGSGKTFTMLGPSEESDNFKHEQRGVIPRSFEHLFNLINRDHELHGERKQFLCKCSFLEIYQEQVYDLLDPAAANLQLRENIKKGVFVDGLTEQVVSTPTEAYQALSMGWLNRRVASTAMNRESSRSHAVFTLVIESKEEKNGVKNVRESQLNLVDLAGSERQKDTNTIGIRLKEAGKINQSLSVLGNVIMSLVKIAQGRPQHIPYRDSKLTFLLRDSLGGNARTSIVACVHPDAKCFGETLSTLNFARRAKQIKNKAVINEDTQGNVLHLQNEIRRLRDMLGQFQSGSIPPSITMEGGGEGEGHSATLTTQATGDAAEWKIKFFEAMLFREKSEQEKEGICQQLKMMEEDGKKKDRIVQSSRLIIKLRESTIAQLEKKAKNSDTPPTLQPPENSKVYEDLAAVKTRLDQYPQMSQMDQQLHSLRAQLTDARIRLSNTTAALLNSNRLADLAEAFNALQAAHRRESLEGSPRSGESRTSVTLQKLREKVEALEQDNEQLQKQSREERQGWETKEAKLQAELTAERNMTTELECLLQANNLKHRISHDAMASLHCQTIKGLTPNRNSYDLRSRTVICGSETENSDASLDQSILTEKDSEEDICMETPPATMVENAHEVLTEEIKVLQQTNSSLQERLNEYEADMVRVRQQVNQLDLEKDSITEILSKERKEGSEKVTSQEEATRELKKTTEALTAELERSKVECRDYQLILQQSDKQWKEEKVKAKAQTSATDEKINVLETQLLQVQGSMETVLKQLEEETKEREVMEEKLDTERTEKAFMEEHVHTLEEALQQQTLQCQAAQGKLQEMEESLAVEKEEQQRLQERSQQFGQQEEKRQAEVSDLQSRIGDLTKDCEEKRKELDVMATEMEATKIAAAELRRDVSDNREALQQQVQRVQELKTRLQESEDRCCVLQDTADRRGAEVTEAQQQCTTLTAQLQAKTDEISAAAVDREMLNEDLAFYQEQNEKAVQECQTLRHNVESLEEMKEKLQNEIQSLKTEVGDKDRRLQMITQHLEDIQTQRMGTPQASPERPMDRSSYPFFMVKGMCIVGEGLGCAACVLWGKDCAWTLTVGTIQESQLAAMVEELTQGREQWREQNEQLTRELDVLREEVRGKDEVSKKCQDLQCQLDNQNIVFKDSIHQLQELVATEQSETQILRDSLAEAQRQQESAAQDKQRLVDQAAEAQSERQHAEEELDRLKSVVEKSYRERDQLQSHIEVIKEKYKKAQEELKDSDHRSQELADHNAQLAGHTNQAQKIMYVKKIQTDFNTLKEKVNDVRVGDVFRKLDDKGYAFCVPCGKKMSYANRGLIALRTHMARKAHIKNASAVKDNATILFE
ncbi:hypothetical protein ACOMHN_017905 [Nucella lapillus]